MDHNDSLGHRSTQPMASTDRPRGSRGRSPSLWARWTALACASCLGAVAFGQSVAITGSSKATEARSAQAGAQRASIAAVLAPVFVRIDQKGSVAADAVARVLAAIDANPGRVVAIDLGSIPVTADGTPAGQTKLAKELEAVVRSAKQARGKALVAVSGLPIERLDGQRGAARAVNDRFAAVVRAADAVVVRGNLIGRNSNEANAVAAAFPEAVRLAGSKSVVYRDQAGGGTSGAAWKARTAAGSAAKGAPAPRLVAMVPPSSGGASPTAMVSGTALDGGSSASGGPTLALPSTGGPSGASAATIEVLNNWGGSVDGDLNGDGVVDARDLALSLALGDEGDGADDPPVVIGGPGGGGDGGGGGGGGGGGDGGAGGGGSGGGDDPVGGGDNGGGGGGGGGVGGVVLPSGSGFAGPTAQPPNIGAPSLAGFDARAIARWSTVPFQMVNDQIRIGVVAFHRNGIERVSFSANGGPWTDVVSMTVNPSTGISEYWATLRAQDFPDGPVEIRAIAYPKTAGIPRVLGGAFQTSIAAAPPLSGEYSLTLWTNANGTLTREPRYVSGTGDDASGNGSLSNPFRTLSRAAQSIQQQYGSVNGATIFCLPGEYDFQMKWGTTNALANDRFITITPAPGVARSDVVIEEARPKTGRVRLSNVTLKTNTAGNFYTGYSDLRMVLWLENCHVSSLNGRYGSNQQVLLTCTSFVTETTWTDTPDGPLGAVLVRNTEITKLKSDMVSGVQVVLNVNGSDIDPANTGAHPDIYQIYRPSGGMDNHIIYGLRANNFLAQGIFIALLANGEKIRNSAFVNVVLDANQSNFSSQLNRASEHLLLVNCTLDQTFFIRTGDFTNVSFVGNLFRAVTLDLSKCTPAQVATIDWRHNHFNDATSFGTYTFGTDVTTGPAPVVNWALGDFRPLKSSSLADRLGAIYSNYDASGLPREPMTAVGALEEQQ